MRVTFTSLFYGCVRFIIVVHTTATLSQTTSLGLVEQRTTDEHRSSLCTAAIVPSSYLVGEDCEYSNKENKCVDKFDAITAEDNLLWDFAAGTKYILTTFDNCLGDIYHQNPNLASSIYNVSRLGISLEKGSYQLYITSLITGFGGGQFLLHLLLASTDSEAKDINCSYYKYYQVESAKGNAFQAHFTDRCFLTIQPSSIYNLYVTNTHSNFTRVFRIFAPSELHVDSANDSSDDWNSLIGVSIHSRTIEIHTQPAPASDKHYYVLHVTYSRGERVQLVEHHTRLLHSSVTKWTFESIGDLFYTIDIKRCQGRWEGADLSDISSCRLVQQQTLVSSDIATQGQGESTNSNLMERSSTTKDVQVIRETDSGILQKQDLYILLGTIFGVVVLVLIIVVVLLIYFKRRHNSQYGQDSRFSPENEYSDDILLDEVSKGAPPSVLLLYSYDCQQHLACVQALALLLQNGLGCSVMADFWATQEIAERGIYAWLQRKLATVNYIIVVCSTGARFKSVANRRLKLERVADDAYVMAMRQLQAHSSEVNGEKLAVYFDYSSESDIPVLFEKWQRYKLPQDIHQFVPSLVDVCPKDRRGSQKGKLQREKAYIEELERKVDGTKMFMDENPDWFHQNLQPEISESPAARRSTLPHKTDQLPLVTVEYDENGRRCDVNERVDVDPALKSGIRSNTVTPVPTLKRQVNGATEAEGTSIVDSYSSSLEDLEQDINFILNPSVPRRVAFPVTSFKSYTSPPVLVNILPDLPAHTAPPHSPTSSLADESFQLNEL